MNRYTHPQVVPSTLLPCPFCGQEAEHRAYAHQHIVTCKVCQAHMSGREGDDVVARWNRRPECKAENYAAAKIKGMTWRNLAPCLAPDAAALEKVKNALFENVIKQGSAAVVGGKVVPIAELYENEKWIEHEGETCPVAPGTLLDLRLRDGTVVRKHVANPDYANDMVLDRIVTTESGGTWRMVSWRLERIPWRGGIIAYRILPS